MKWVKQNIHYWCKDIIDHHYLGEGITVAVLDTGLAPHPDFRNKVCAFRDFVHGQDILYDDNGHGTHVCGVIGGRGIASRGEYAGIAPECNLAVLKVLDNKGNGSVEEVVRASDWILKNHNRYQIRVVNISVGMPVHFRQNEGKRLIQSAESLWDAGLVVVVAAGNLGPMEGSITVPGISKKVITVGSSDDRHSVTVGGGRKVNYSGRGPTEECVCKPDVVAPGSHIASCNAEYIKQRGKPYIIKSGTSMATPVVSGAIADLLSKYPDMSNIEVKLRLRDTSSDLGLEQNRQGWGMLNVEALLL